MADPLLAVFTTGAPADVVDRLADPLKALESGTYKQLFDHPLAQLLLGWRNNDELNAIQLKESQSWIDWIFVRLGHLTAPCQEASFRRHFLFLVGIAALQTFVQSNMTGPPLHFRCVEVLWPDYIRNSRSVSDERQRLVDSLNVDGIAAHRLTFNIELFCLADAIFTCPPIKKDVAGFSWARLRTDFLHQRLLAEPSSLVQGKIYEGLAAVEPLVQTLARPETALSYFLVERAAIHTHHGLDRKARQDLDAATRRRRFSFALTGKLGKRTRFQERDTSQLVVLAKSSSDAESLKNGEDGTAKAAPTALDLNDDTLLESISFTGTNTSSTDIRAEESLPPELLALDPGKQPRLEALDSVILLQLASSITNTSPADGLTREETLPYATRVVDGGSSNWQVYTQALLVRSRIEGYRSRTTERGLLQLQALVDQVIADTIPETPTGLTPGVQKTESNTTFLPRPKASESAPVAERVEYVYALSSPTRRELEAELAQRWVSVGGLRSALDIYERLEMWAEAALCWAATDREDKAKAIINRQLNHQTSGPNSPFDPDGETWQGPPRDPAPSDAPRLYCILGDIDNDVDMYEKAWTVSNKRYARAKRSLGRIHYAAKDFAGAADAYTAALEVNQLNGASWFALGCALLELGRFERAVESFARTVQLDESDAEAWSNLAAALLKRGPVPAQTPVSMPTLDIDGDADDDEHDADTPRAPTNDEQKHKRDALRAFKRAASLKYDSSLIWHNVLTVSGQLRPPAYADAINAQSRIIELRGKSEGESCIDADILDALVAHVTTAYPSGAAPARPGSIPAQLARLVGGQVAPLITRSAQLWGAVAALRRWEGRPVAALDAHEKAWRAATGAHVGWEGGSAAGWEGAVGATAALADAYAALGPLERSEGLAAGSGELVARDWRFKARSAVRGIMGRGKESWEGTEGWERLAECLESLKGGA